MKDHNNQIVKSNNQLAQSKPTTIGAWVNNTEKELCLAVEGKQLQHFKNNDMNTLKGMIVKWIYMLGLTNKIDEKDIIALTKITQELFPKITLKQLELAIKYSMQGTLGVDIECYGNFSPLYISKILNAYLKFSREKIHEVSWRTKSIERMDEQRALEKPYHEEVADIRKIVTLYIERVTKSHDYMGDYNNTIWELLKRAGMIDPTKINLEEADEWADNRVKLESMSTEAKRYNRMSPQQKEKEMSLYKKLYGRYYVMKKVFRTMSNPIEWLNQLPNETIYPKK